MAFPTTKIRKKIRYFTVDGSMPEEAWVRITFRFLKSGRRKSCAGGGGGCGCAGAGGDPGLGGSEGLRELKRGRPGRGMAHPRNRFTHVYTASWVPRGVLRRKWEKD